MASKRNRPNSSPSAKDGKKKKDTEVLYPCVTCGKEVESECIECEWCYNWEHKDCVGLSNDIYEVLGGAPAIVMFFCTKCEPKVKLTLKLFADIQQKQQAMDEKLRQLEEKFSKSISDINTQLGPKTNVNTESAMDLEGNRSITTDKIPAMSDITNTLTSILSEEKEKEKRMFNLIVHKVPESTSSSAQERKAYDLNQVNTIIQKHLGLETTIDNPIRLGKRDPVKTRLLKITVASLKFKKEILCNNAKLRDMSDPAWVNSIFITPDLTPKQ